MSLFTLLISSAYAQEAAAASPKDGLMQFAPLAIIFVMFYFLILRPQKRKMEEEAKVTGALKKGDEIYTKSGILGKVHGITDKIVTLEVEDGAKMKVLKSHVGGLAKSIFSTEKK